MSSESTAVTAFYVGAGTDVEPLELFPEIMHMICFDGQPNSEFGKSVYIMEDGTNGLSRPTFIPELVENMGKINFQCEKEQEAINNLQFTHGNRRVDYMINTAIPEDVQELKNKIPFFDMLICRGHDPDSSIMDFAHTSCIFVGFTTTVYNYNYEDMENNNSIVCRLNEDYMYQQKFSIFILVDSYSESITKYTTWKAFLQAHKSFKTKF